jgi:hypothetical protein
MHTVFLDFIGQIIRVAENVLSKIDESLHLVVEVADHVVPDLFNDGFFYLAEDFTNANFEVACFIAACRNEKRL